jgi:XTP/dITP diphosphohydrolase
VISAVTVYCATSNPGKLREFQLAAPDFDVQQLPRPVPPPEEHGATFEETAVTKAEYYGSFVDGYLFADDSGLEVDALGGAPGVHSARYAASHLNREATDAENNELLLQRLTGITDRRARFVCVIALIKDGKLLHIFRGAVEGRILDAPRGSGGFGYDPLFYYPPFGCTFGEAFIGDKMLVSHRAQALEAMFTFLRGLLSSEITLPA